MKKFSFIVLFICSVLIGSAQHPYFASLNQQLLSLNPAFAGSNKELRVQTGVNLRDPALSRTYNSYYFGADILVGKYSGLGLSAYYTDWAVGTLKQAQFNLTYALHLTINDKLKVVPAFQASYFRKEMNVSKLYFGDLADPLYDLYLNTFNYYPLTTATKQNMDFSLGVLTYKENFYFGASVLSFLGPDEGLLGFYKRQLTQNYQGGYNFKFGRHGNFNTYVFVKIQKVVGNFLQYGAYAGNRIFQFHLANRISDSKIDFSKYYGLITGFNFKVRNFKIGYNYFVYSQRNFVDLRFKTSYELYLSFNMGNWKKKTESKPDDQKPEGIRMGDW